MLPNDESPVAIGLRLRRLRMMAGFEQLELAKLARVSKTSLSNWETARGNRPMKRSNMTKLMKVIRTAGVEADENWLLTGIGMLPRLTFFLKEESAVYHACIPAQQLAIVESELKLFATYRPQAVMLKIENDRLSPFLRKGDHVAGEWQESRKFVENDFCLIEEEGELTVRYVVPAKNNASFYLCHTPTADITQMKAVALIRLAPLIRVWR